MNNARFLISKATLADASLIADLGARTFKTAFGAYNSEEDMEHYLISNFSEENIQSQLSNPSSTFLLGYQNDIAVGYVMLDASQPLASVTGSNPIELVRIYVDDGVVGQGLGSALMKACLEEAKKNGFETIWLGVWQSNHRAIDFYRKWGFEPVGVKQFVLGRDVQDDFIMARPIDLAA